MSLAYARPGALDEALALLAAPGAQRARRRHRPRARCSRGIGPADDGRRRARGCSGDAIERAGDGLAHRRRDARRRRRRRRARRRALRGARPGGRGGRLAAAARDGHGGRQPGQHVRCWYFRHPDLTCWLRGRRHLLRPDRRPPQARPRGGRLHLGRAVRPGGGAARAGRERRVTASRRRARFPLAELYRRPSDDAPLDRALARGELITARRRCRAPPARERLRARRRAARPGRSRCARRRRRALRRRHAPGRDRRLTTLPRLLDPADPLAGLPGLEQTGWKRRLLQALADDALARGGVSRIGIAAGGAPGRGAARTRGRGLDAARADPLKTKPRAGERGVAVGGARRVRLGAELADASAPLQRLRPERRRHALPGEPGRDAGRPRHGHPRPHARLHPAARDEVEHPPVRPADAHRLRTAGGREHAERRGRARRSRATGSSTTASSRGVPGPAGRCSAT